MTAYGYARVSSVGSEDLLERQAEAIKSECDKRGLESLVMLSEPAGTSAVSRLIIGIDRSVFFRDTVGNKEVSHAEEIYCSLIERGA